MREPARDSSIKGRRKEAGTAGPAVGSVGGSNEEEIRQAAYFIWQENQSKPAEVCWLEAKNRICK